jgi:hypothetical protein
MALTKQIIQSKINYLQNELEALKDYFYVPETYQYLIDQLDAQQVLLKHLEVEEQFAAIESGMADSDATPVVRSCLAVESQLVP